MTETLAYISIAAACAAMIALALVALRLRRARREFTEKVADREASLNLDLQRARKDRDQLLDALAEGFLLVDADAEILFANKAAQQLFRERDLVGLSVPEAFLNRRMTEALMTPQAFVVSR